jgi:hypothetical protein
MKESGNVIEMHEHAGDFKERKGRSIPKDVFEFSNVRP